MGTQGCGCLILEMIESCATEISSVFETSSAKGCQMMSTGNERAWHPGQNNFAPRLTVDVRSVERWK